MDTTQAIRFDLIAYNHRCARIARTLPIHSRDVPVFVWAGTGWKFKRPRDIEKTISELAHGIEA